MIINIIDTRPVFIKYGDSNYELGPPKAHLLL